MRAALLLAQCTGAEKVCELPRGIPWWMGVAIAAVWLATVVGAFRLWRHRRELRRRDDVTNGLPAIDERTTGTDVERW